jgi:hypothetical protein
MVGLLSLSGVVELCQCGVEGKIITSPRFAHGTNWRRYWGNCIAMGYGRNLQCGVGIF